jgi:oligosaccharide repeat unit polymerase
MLLLGFLVILFLFFNLRKPVSPGLLLILIYLASLTAALLIGRDYAFASGFEAFNIIFTGVALSVMILPWNKFSYKTPIVEPDPMRMRNLTRVLLVVNGFCFLIFLTICFYAFSEVVDYSAFKNEGQSATFIDQIPILNPTLSHFVYLLASYIHSCAYFLVPLHFYYLYKRKWVLSLVCLVLSSNLILYGLTIFSRSSFATYCLVYLFSLPFFFRKLEPRARRVILASAFALVCIAAVPFAVITASRFSNIVAYNRAVSDQTLISSPEVYSLFDYGGQWYRNGNEVMATYSFDTMNGELSFPFVLMIADRLHLIDYPPEQLELRLRGVWGDHYDRFNGLVANLLFDFGYVGTMFFVGFYAFLLLLLRPVQGELSFTNQLILGGLFVLPAAGIFNSELKSVTYDSLIIFSIATYVYMKRQTSA